ncbi:hypothetical protein BSPWISOXPB_3818 [uncultured Gammaproteobacteria bacterium]|nr:hypothetical protein BSPWISOXPB_3818 [uncultured Gammaproteobacteria bacterium]
MIAKKKKIKNLEVVKEYIKKNRRIKQKKQTHKGKGQSVI